MKKKILPYLLAPMILIMGVLYFIPLLHLFAYSLKKMETYGAGKYSLYWI